MTHYRVMDQTGGVVINPADYRTPRDWMEDRARDALNRLVALCGIQAANEACEQAGLPEVFCWTSVGAAQLGALLVALRIRLMEAGAS